MAEPAAVYLVTGTGTGIGKTVTAAALVSVLRSTGSRVVAVKPTQTGLAPGEPGDLDDLRRLAGDVETHEPVRLRAPLAPDTAARLEGAGLPRVTEHASLIASLARRDNVDAVVVEGAGGLLVRVDADGATLADLAPALADLGVPARYLVVVAAGLGTLNHSALTAEALRRRGLACLGLVVGSWPAEPDLASRCNLHDLPVVTGLPLLGRIPQGAGALTPERFREQAARWIPADSLTRVEWTP